jgi:hypothetical protein
MSVIVYTHIHIFHIHIPVVYTHIHIFHIHIPVVHTHTYTYSTCTYLYMNIMRRQGLR